MRSACLFLLAMAASVSAPAFVLAQDLILDGSQWGRLSVDVDRSADNAPTSFRASLGGSLESVLSQNANFEPLSTYHAESRLRRMGRPVGRLDIRFRSGDFTLCTATLVGESTILTNYHCVPNTPEKIRQYGPVTQATLVMNYYDDARSGEAKRYRVNITPIRANAQNDFAYLSVEGSPGREFGVATIKETPPRPGSSLLIIHHPGGKPLHVTRGNCRAASPQATDAGGVQLFHLCDTLPGSSGAPIFSDDDGSIIAIHKAGADVTGPGAKNFGVLASALQAAAVAGGQAARPAATGRNESAGTMPRRETARPAPARTPPPQTAGPVTGIDVDRIRFFMHDGRQASAWMLDPLTWRVAIDGDPLRHHPELFRDEWSVYLDDGQGRIVLQLDLFSQHVLHHTPRGREELGRIEEWSGPAEDGVTGRNVVVVRYDAGSGRVGSFVQVRPDLWIEIRRDGRHVEWQELGRDDWSVFLRDRGGNTVQLDLYQKTVVNDFRGQRRPVLRVLAASSHIGG